MYTKITNEPTVEPVSLTEAKLHLRVDHNDDDVLIAGLIQSARQSCENYEGKSYCVRTYTLKMDSLFDVCLPYPPLISVDSITYIDDDGDTQTLSTDIYDIDTHSDPGYIYLAYNQTWPMTRSELNAVTITYKSGYMTKFTCSGDTLTVNEAILSDGDTVLLVTDQGDLPAELAESTTYWVRDVSGLTLKLSATDGGAAITTTDAGTGTHLIGATAIPARVCAAIKLIVAHLYEHREELSETKLEPMLFAARSLLFDRNMTV
ncbi:MAG: hypothetical protein B6244_14130 [Candidatus Cloacimonetes bacterium 4572_55]|nr:MAG: hypothetical protein B6244_14130 [Candidatus Cloacimonetes bacterium 4572_55]